MLWDIAVFVFEKANPAWIHANAKLVLNCKLFKSSANLGKFSRTNLAPSMAWCEEIGLALIFHILSIECERASKPVDIDNSLGL